VCLPRLRQVGPPQEQQNQPSSIFYPELLSKNPQNPLIRSIRYADKKGRNTDEPDYADYTESCAARRKILIAIYRCKGELQFAPTFAETTKNQKIHKIP
jgi:hypothetical protein